MDTHKDRRTTQRQHVQWRLWRRWIGASAAGELIALPLAVLIGAAAAHAWGGMALIAAGALAGGVNGALVGGLQWLALRRPIQRLSGWQWILVTALGSALPWALVLRVSGSLHLAQANDTGLLGGMLLMGLLAGTLLGGAQWLALRRVLHQAAWWLPATILAWLLGMSVMLAGGSLIQSGTPVWTLLLVSGVTGLVLGSLLGAITGLALVALLRPQVVSRHQRVSAPAGRIGRLTPTQDPAEANVVRLTASPRW